jgi:hypothetical protein
MSARREVIGMDTTAVNRVAVSNQDASSSGAPNMCGNWGMSGTTNVACTEATVPERDKRAIVNHGGTTRAPDSCRSVLALLLSTVAPPDLDERLVSITGSAVLTTV